MQDQNESVRRELVAKRNTVPGSREALEAEHGQVWDTTELGSEFEVLGFAAPLVVVRRRSDRHERIALLSTPSPILLRISAGPLVTPTTIRFERPCCIIKNATIPGKKVTAERPRPA
jgi:hypothetical protein